MRTRCSDVTAAALCLLALAAMPALACATRLPCTEEGFIAQLLRFADETHPSAVPGDFDRLFGVDLARYTRVFVSALLQPGEPFGVARFVRLGDSWYPLSFGVAGECVTFEPIERLFKADGWEGGRTAAPGKPEVWLYRKGKTQFLAEPMSLKDPSGNPRTCVQSVLLTFR